MDPALAEPHASLAWVNAWYDFDFAAAERGFERAIELNPRYPIAHYWFGYFLGLTGRYEEGYTEFQRAIRLDPTSAVVRWGFGILYWCSRRYDEAIESLGKALELDPAFAGARGLLAWVFECKCLYEQAIAVGEKAAEIGQGAPTFLFGLAQAYARAGHRVKAQKILQRLQELSAKRYVTPYGLARIHAALDNADEAVRLLEAAYQEHATWLLFLKTDPHLDSLRPDPRFQDLLRRMNFPEAQ
jgi:tetratricopeptide (TPR) repeat protein